MNRIDRLTAILIHLQGKPRVPIEELEERFEMSRRTLFRDIRSLMEAGVPIGGDAGQGYFIVEGYHLPPVVFNKEEAAAILLGAKLIEKNADDAVSKQFQEAMIKIKAVLRYNDKEFLDNLDKSISVVGSPSTQQIGFPESHIGDIQSALALKKKIEITYFSNYNETISVRTVSPLGLVFYTGRWHLIAHCHLREDLRDFRTDRIQKIRVTNENYNPVDYPDHSSFIYGMIGGTEKNEGIIRFSKEVSRFIQDQKYFYGFVSETKTEKHVEMTFLTPHYKYLARWILMFLSEAEVISPPELKELVIAYSEELTRHHNSRTPVT